MKVRVICGYIDKETGKSYSVGDTIDVTDKRYAEIQQKGNFIKKMSEAKEAEQPKKAEKAKK